MSDVCKNTYFTRLYTRSVGICIVKHGDSKIINCLGVKLESLVE